MSKTPHQRERWLWLLNLLLGLGVLGGFYYIYDQVGVLGVLHSDLALAVNQRNNLYKIKNIWEDSAAERERVLNYFVTSESLPQFIERLEGLAAAANVELELTGAVAETGKQPAVKMELAVGGGFREIFHFLTLLDHAPAILETNHLELQPRSVEQEGQLVPAWSAEMSLRLLSFAPETNSDL